MHSSSVRVIAGVGAESGDPGCTGLNCEEFALGRKRLELIGMASRHFDSGGEVVEIARILREMKTGVAETVQVICSAMNLDFFAVTEIVENVESAD